MKRMGKSLDYKRCYNNQDSLGALTIAAASLYFLATSLVDFFPPPATGGGWGTSNGGTVTGTTPFFGSRFSGGCRAARAGAGATGGVIVRGMGIPGAGGNEQSRPSYWNGWLSLGTLALHGTSRWRLLNPAPGTGAGPGTASAPAAATEAVAQLTRERLT
jgi:hypothetical protein